MLGASVTPRRKPAARAATPSRRDGAAPPAASSGREGPAEGGGRTPGSAGTDRARHVVVDSEAVLQVVSMQVGVPVGQLRGDPRWFAELREALQSAVLGQDSATRCESARLNDLPHTGAGWVARCQGRARRGGGRRF